MKTLKNLLIGTMGSLLLYFSACTPEDNELIIPPGSEPSKEISMGMEAKINNRKWNAVNYKATVTSRRIVIRGKSDSLGSITITLLDTAAGTYYLNPTSGNYASYTDTINYLDIYTTYSSVRAGGLVIISKYNKDSSFVSGNFNITVYNKKLNKYITISQGSFVKVKFTVDKPLVTGISAKTKDSLAWTASAGVDGRISDRFISITGSSRDSSKLTFCIYNNLPGTYTLNNTSMHFATFLPAKPDTNLYQTKLGVSSCGMIVIDKISKDSVISGSFVFSLARKDGVIINISDGVFKEIKLRQ